MHWLQQLLISIVFVAHLFKRKAFWTLLKMMATIHGSPEDKKCLPQHSEKTDYKVKTVTVITGVLPATVYNPHPPKLNEYVFEIGV